MRPAGIVLAVSERNRTLLNVVILLVLAAIVWRIPGGATGGAVVRNVISLIFWGGLIFFVYRLYMERRSTLMGWDDKLRVQLYVSVAAMLLLVVAITRMFLLGGLGVLAWFVLIGLALWGIFTAFRSARSY